MIEKKVFEFTIDSKVAGDDEQQFLAIKTGRREDEGGWFNLYLFDGEAGTYELVATLNPGDDLVEAAINCMVEDMDYKRGNLFAREEK